MKIEIIADERVAMLQEKINKFIENKRVIDIKFTEVIGADWTSYMTAYILYEDKVFP